MDTLRHLLRNRRYVSVALVTLLTLGIVGAVVLTTTSAGCGPASALKIKTAHCPATTPVANTNVSSSPSPTFGFPSPSPRPTFVPPPPTNPGASANPPYDGGSSGTSPVDNPASFGGPPIPYAGSASVPGAVFTCRLPIYAGGPGSGGFIVLPGETFVADPRSAVTAPSPPPGTPSPTPQMGPPQYPGWWGTAYDAAYSRWLPVPYAWVSPDGAHYAYALGGDVYAQNVSNGTQLELGKGQNLNVIDVENDGVYGETPGQPGLWFLPFSGAAKQVATTHFWQAVGHGAAYGTATSQVPNGVANTIDRMDLKTGSITEFFSVQSANSQVIGFDLQGHPIVLSYFPSGQAMYIVTGPERTLIANTSPYGGAFPQGPPIADSHGIWFSIGGGIILWANDQWYLMANYGGQLAGPCS